MSHDEPTRSLERLQLPGATWDEIHRIAKETGLHSASVIECFVSFVLKGIPSGAPLSGPSLNAFVEEQFQGSATLIERLRRAAESAEIANMKALALLEIMGSVGPFAAGGKEGSHE